MGVDEEVAVGGNATALVAHLVTGQRQVGARTAAGTQASTIIVQQAHVDDSASAGVCLPTVRECGAGLIEGQCSTAVDLAAVTDLPRNLQRQVSTGCERSTALIR